LVIADWSACFENFLSIRISSTIPRGQRARPHTPTKPGNFLLNWYLSLANSTMASSVPFRFKAGEAAAAHHHRSTTKSSQKPFKSRHATKGAIKDTLKGTFRAENLGWPKERHDD
jgi:hypothetical protein